MRKWINSHASSVRTRCVLSVFHRCLQPTKHQTRANRAQVYDLDTTSKATLLGTGAFGAVYKATEKASGKAVALKKIDVRCVRARVRFVHSHSRRAHVRSCPASKWRIFWYASIRLCSWPKRGKSQKPAVPPAPLPASPERGRHHEGNRHAVRGLVLWQLLFRKAHLDCDGAVRRRFGAGPD